MRQDPTTQEWVIISTERARRPHEFAQEEKPFRIPPFDPECPFCPGNENMTPAPVLVYGDGSPVEWQVRGFPNKFAALSPGKFPVAKDGLFVSMDGRGAHEVIVETPLHNQSLAFMTPGRIAKVLRAYQERYLALAELPFVKHVTIFKNHGESAGTSLVHSHSQIIAAPVIPGPVRRQHHTASKYFETTGRFLYEDILKGELEARDRIVHETEHHVVFHPFASRWPFESWILPRTRQSSFANASGEDLDALAEILKLALLKLHKGLNNPDFNFVIMSAPTREIDEDCYQWHIRIIPRIAKMAGFELGSGIHINIARPEDTASFMRGIDAS